MRKRRKRYVDMHEEMLAAQDWERVQIEAACEMRIIDSLPPLTQQAVTDTAAAAQVSLNWYRKFLRDGHPPAEADRRAADQIRKLVREYEAEEMSQAVAALQRAGKALRAHPRS
jgi:hypothetical protein